MALVKPKNILYSELSTTSGVSERTIKRYFAGANITIKNSSSINNALQELLLQKNKKNREEFAIFPHGLFKVNLFWSSSRTMKRDIDGVIQAYCKHPNIEDIYTLVALFGKTRVKENVDIVFQNITHDQENYHALPEYKQIIRTIEYCDKKGEHEGINKRAS